ncbi:hypothetical protein POX_e07197 [Penicillium oxalicum]|uniref:hypothetical protein n=1 Tax=Penicillium oxalicum TaxID=69781 RepID=UPI0020B8EFF8|nr:hypothetical protein POX_e07197 [Penicillium oxalicum]KAI2789169.1 hypothetical protein POX_e07197 [Penicillium oxalicum]
MHKSADHLPDQPIKVHVTPSLSQDAAWRLGTNPKPKNYRPGRGRWSKEAAKGSSVAPIRLSADRVWYCSHAVPAPRIHRPNCRTVRNLVLYSTPGRTGVVTAVRPSDTSQTHATGPDSVSFDDVAVGPS